MNPEIGIRYSAFINAICSGISRLPRVIHATRNTATKNERAKSACMGYAERNAEYIRCNAALNLFRRLDM